MSSDAINQVCSNLQLTKCINECMGLGKHKCKCANVFVYNLLFPLVQQTSQFVSLALEFLHIVSFASGENTAFSHFAAAIVNHYNSVFSFHQIPITTGWTEAARYERLATHLSHGWQHDLALQFTHVLLLPHTPNPSTNLMQSVHNVLSNFVNKQTDKPTLP